MSQTKLFSKLAIPLARGNNVITIRVVDVYGQVGTDTITVRRRDGSVGRITVDAEAVARVSVDAEAAARLTVAAPCVRRYAVDASGGEPE